MNRFTKNLTSIKPVLFTALVIACLLAAALPVRAATGRLYLTPTTSTVIKDDEVTVSLRIDPGTEINGVGAEILYDVGKLSLIGMDDSGTSFPYILETDISSGKFKMVRATEGSLVTTDSLVFQLTFKALVSSGSTAFTITGNAGKDTSLTNPTVQSASITFVTPGTPTPTAPGSTSTNTNPSTPKQGTVTQSPQTPGQTTTPNPAAQSPTEQTPQEKAATNQPEIARQAKRARSKAWMVFAGLAILIVLVHMYLTIKDVRATQAAAAAQPIVTGGPALPVITPTPVQTAPPAPTPPTTLAAPPAPTVQPPPAGADPTKPPPTS